MNYCCSVFPKIARQMNWMVTTADDGNSELFLMPHYHNQNDDIRYRINFCPHCGKDIRGIVISKEEFDELK